MSCSAILHLTVETGSLTEPGYRLEVGKPSGPPVCASHSVGVTGVYVQPLAF